jgi:multidrug efflux pump subunit AcrB
VIRAFAGHPTAANLLMVFILVLGIAALPSLRRETFPEIPPDEIEIALAYPGASAVEVEEAICRRLEDGVEGVSGVNEMRCEAREGRATATVEMVEGDDFDRLLTDVKTQVDAIDDFPEEVEVATVRQLGLTDFVVAIAVTGPMSVPDLKLYAERLKDRLQQEIPEISRVDVRGFSDHQIRIEIPAQSLRQYGLSVADIAATIGRQSLDLPAGTIESPERDVLLRFEDERRNAAEFAELIVVGGGAGAEVRLGDIARISDRFESDEEQIVVDGRRAALIEVQKGKDDDTL